MEILIQNFRKKIARTSLDFIRSTEFEINWNARLICIRGPRGVGKTTLMLQHIKKKFSENMQQVMYVSLDNLYFTDNSNMLCNLSSIKIRKDFRQFTTLIFLDHEKIMPYRSMDSPKFFRS